MGNRLADPDGLLRPHRRLFSRGVAAIALFTTPVFAVLYWLAIPRGVWQFVLILHLVAVGLTVWAVLQLRRTTIRLTPGGVTERGFLGREHHVPTTRVRSVMLVDVYQGSSLETTPQLFVVDADGRLLLRMRGQFWSAADMERVVDHVGADLEHRPDPVTMAELRQSSPGLLYWFERGIRFR